MGSQPSGIDSQTCDAISKLLKKLHDLSVGIGVVIGGGNIFRGLQGASNGMERSHADHIGMLATIINGITLQQALQKLGCPAKVVSALGGSEIVEAYTWHKTQEYLQNGYVVIFVGGTGNPYFTTDTNAALRAAQIRAEVLLKATKVDGIYDKDPIKHPDAVRFARISHQEVLAKGLKVMDPSAVSICLENQIPIKVFSTFSLLEAVTQPDFGTLVTKEA
jgi:uridylate kinase